MSRGRRWKGQRRHSQGREPWRGPWFRYHITFPASGVDEQDRAWKGHHAERRKARRAA